MNRAISPKWNEDDARELIECLINQEGYMRLDSWFNAWKNRFKDEIEISRDLSLGYELPELPEPPIPDGHEGKPNSPYLPEDMEWFDEQIMRLNPKQKRLIWYDVIHKKDRNKIDKWLKEFGLSGATNWYNMRHRIRSKLMRSITSRFSGY